MNYIFICGMQSEVEAISAGSKDMVIYSAGNRATLQQKLSAFDQSTPEEMRKLFPGGVISFGVCGALDPELQTGDVANPVGSPTVVATEAQRESLWLAVEGSGINAVDNETDMAKGLAKTLDLPFRTMRVVLDQTNTWLPPASLLPLNWDGTPDGWAIAMSILRNPLQIPALIGLGIRQTKALGVLSELRATLD